MELLRYGGCSTLSRQSETEDMPVLYSKINCKWSYLAYLSTFEYVWLYKGHGPLQYKCHQYHSLLAFLSQCPPVSNRAIRTLISGGDSMSVLFVHWAQIWWTVNYQLMSLWVPSLGCSCWKNTNKVLCSTYQILLTNQWSSDTVQAPHKSKDCTEIAQDIVIHNNHVFPILVLDLVELD